jgi:hypothetical protein
MANQRAVDLALDLARMPAFASSMAASPLPIGVLEVIRIAAECPDACRAAALTTGLQEPVLVEAARFYLQQILFRPEADCYRVLGIRPDDSRELARVHMRWLLLWLHPDRNGGWDAIYAKRIVKAWREVSTGSCAAGNSRPTTAGGAERRGRGNNQTRRFSASVHLPLIKWPIEKAWGRKKSYPRFPAAALRIAAGLVTILLLLGLTAPASGSNATVSELSVPGDCRSASSLT